MGTDDPVRAIHTSVSETDEGWRLGVNEAPPDLSSGDSLVQTSELTLGPDGDVAAVEVTDRRVVRGDTRPVLLVDVDGVANAYGIQAELEPPESWEASWIVDGMPVLVPKGLGLMLEELEDLYECWWCTGWLDRAPKVLGPLLARGTGWGWVDLDKSPHWSSAAHASIQAERLGLTWKLPVVRDWALEHARGRPLAWIDDDIGADAIEWAEHRDRMGNPTRIAVTQPHVGLTRGQADALIDWAVGLAAGVAVCPHCENREVQDGTDPHQQVRAFCPVCARTGYVRTAARPEDSLDREMGAPA